MTQEHPITPPPPELVLQWIGEFFGCRRKAGALSDSERFLTTRAAQWGADQQLELDAKWLDHNALNEAHLKIAPMGEVLKEAMRPKPPSLKEQALEVFDKLEHLFDGYGHDGPTIRRALEALPD